MLWLFLAAHATGAARYGFPPEELSTRRCASEPVFSLLNTSLSTVTQPDMHIFNMREVAMHHAHVQCCNINRTFAEPLSQQGKSRSDHPDWTDAFLPICTYQVDSFQHVHQLLHVGNMSTQLAQVGTMSICHMIELYSEFFNTSLTHDPGRQRPKKKPPRPPGKWIYSDLLYEYAIYMGIENGRPRSGLWITLLGNMLRAASSPRSRSGFRRRTRATSSGS